METLRIGDKGEAVYQLQQQLISLGYSLGQVDGHFGDKTDNAVRLFQQAAGLTIDGIFGRQSYAKLAKEYANKSRQETQSQSAEVAPTIGGNGELVDEQGFHTPLVKRICHGSPAVNIDSNWPLIEHSLRAQSLADLPMMLMAIATVYVETGSFKPISEYLSKYNTTFTSHDFDKYDDRKDLGNTGAPDGARFKGRGYIQLTGRANYRNIGELIDLGNALERQPELANDGDIAGQVLAAFLKRQEASIRAALEAHDLAKARRIVNGGRHGLPEFERCYNLGLAASGA